MTRAAARPRVAVACVRRNLDLRALPAAVALYILRARHLAERRGEVWARRSSLSPASLAELLALAGAADRVAELGTAMGWTIGALALARSTRSVTSYDPVSYPGRAEYLGLLGAGVRARIELVAAAGADGPGRRVARHFDLVFIDASHERAPTVAEFAAWAPAVRPGGAIAFHDYVNPEFPGVRAAIHADLGLAGEQVADMFVWRKAVAAG